MSKGNRASNSLSQLVFLVAGVAIITLGLLLKGGSFSAPRIQLPLITTGLALSIVPFFISNQARARLSLLFLSCGFAIVLSEFLLRTFTLHPINSNSNKVVDAELGHRSSPRLSDVDANGFRNPGVVQQADIVTIGDSHTYGFNVQAEDSWPRQLERSTGYSVYNLGIGGFGFLQYHCLVDRALDLEPKYLVMGVYFGNDMANIRQKHRKVPEARQWCIANGFAAAFDDVSVPKGALPWALDREIREKTAIGSLLAHSFPGYELTPPAGIAIRHPSSPTRIVWPTLRARKFLDVGNERNEAAYLAAQAMLKRAQSECLRIHCRLIVFFIPSKEFVYHDYLVQQNAELPTLYYQAVKWEGDLVRRTQRFLDDQQIPHCEAYSGMIRALDDDAALYLKSSDGHPLEAGYRVYAHAVRDKIKAYLGDKESKSQGPYMTAGALDKRLQ